MVAPFTSHEKHEVIYYANKPKVVKREFHYYGVRQKPPYVSTAFSGRLNFSHIGTGAASESGEFINSAKDEARTVATNKAYGRLVGQLGQTSQLGSSLTSELDQTRHMLTDTVVQLYKSARAMKQGKLVEAARHLGIAPPTERIREVITTRRHKGKRKRVRVKRSYIVMPSGREVAKSTANKWLWWSYGASPLMQDAHNSIDVLCRDLPWNRIKGSGSHVARRTRSGDVNVRVTVETKCSVSMSLMVRVSNPNTFLMTQLGLTNPAQWLLEGIPFSFVVDWFSNLSQIVNSLTDFVGLETTDPVTGMVLANKYEYIYLKPQDAQWSTGKTMIEFSRALSIRQPKLHFAYERFYWQRGANAISLLVGMLGSTPRR